MRFTCFLKLCNHHFFLPLHQFVFWQQLSFHLPSYKSLEDAVLSQFLRRSLIKSYVCRVEGLNGMSGSGHRSSTVEAAVCCHSDVKTQTKLRPFTARSAKRQPLGSLLAGCVQKWDTVHHLKQSSHITHQRDQPTDTGAYIVILYRAKYRRV